MCYGACKCGEGMRWRSEPIRAVQIQNSPQEEEDESQAGEERSNLTNLFYNDNELVNPKGRDTEDRATVLYTGGVH